jgi:hypothetical protein
MTRKPQPKQDDPEQSKRFLDAAKEAGAENDVGAFERAFSMINVRKATSSKGGHSDVKRRVGKRQRRPKA